MLWPGYVSYHRANSKIFGGLYIGNGIKNVDLPFFSYLKPLMKYYTSIDFGNLIYETEAIDILRKSNMKIITNEIIEGSVNNMWQVAKIIIIDPY